MATSARGSSDERLAYEVTRTTPLNGKHLIRPLPFSLGDEAGHVPTPFPL